MRRITLPFLALILLTFSSCAPKPETSTPKEATPEPPGSEPEKVKLAAPLLVSAGGLESIAVLGAVVSTVQA